MKTDIIFDCDDVLLDWIDGFRLFVSMKLGRNIEGRPESWSMSAWLGIEGTDCVALIQEFNASEDFGYLCAVEGSIDFVRARHAQGHRLHVMTSCSSDHVTQKRRRVNLQNVFGDVFDTITCLPLGTAKFDFLQMYRPGSHWYEDNTKNATMGLELGMPTFLRTTPHNATTPIAKDIVRYDNILETGKFYV